MAQAPAPAAQAPAPVQEAEPAPVQDDAPLPEGSWGELVERFRAAWLRMGAAGRVLTWCLLGTLSECVNSSSLPGGGTPESRRPG